MKTGFDFYNDLPRKELQKIGLILGAGFGAWGWYQLAHPSEVHPSRRFVGKLIEQAFGPDANAWASIVLAAFFVLLAAVDFVRIRGAKIRGHKLF